MTLSRRAATVYRLVIAASLGLSASPTFADADPVPLNRIAQDMAETLIVDGLGHVPLGQAPVALYKVADFVRTIGEAAVEKEDRTRGADIILMRSDAALIHGLVAQGQGNGPKAEAAKARLRDLRDRLDSQDPGDV